jgi:hypothetical protein
LALAAAAYSGYWFTTAARLRAGVERWAAARQAEGRDLRWTSVAVEGFPLSFRLRVTAAALRGERPVPFEASSPILTGEAWPWNLRHWRVSASAGAQLRTPIQDTALAAAALDGEIAFAASGGMAVTLRAHQIAATGGAALRVAEAELQFTLPDRAPASHRDMAVAAALRLSGLTLPRPVPPLGDTVDLLTLAGTVNGALPLGPLRQALAAWRDDGGTVELQDGAIRWGTLSLAARGTLALDDALQPMGALTATVEDQNAVIDAAVAQGSLRVGDADLAKIFLGLMAQSGPDGKRRLTVPLSLQKGRAYLGPAQIATLPRFTWE